jgi:PIN domain nuclease of toxin-antitoxin system
VGGPARLKLLLDTHIWLWTLQDPKRFGRRVLQLLKDEANELWLSPVSTWEALTLNFKGRIHIKGNLTEWLARATAGTREAPLTHEIALVARQLPLHQDPADRILAATAEVLDLTLVTADERLLGLGTIRTMANR